jgi:hypothetical protein
LVCEGRTRCALPGYRLLFEQCCKEVEFLFEQLLILAKLISEQRKRFCEGAPAENNFGAPPGYGIKGRKALKYADWIIRTEHRDSRAQSYAFRSPGNRGKNHLRRGYGEIGAMMLAEADEIDAQFVGEDGFVDDVADNLRVSLRISILADGNVAERVETQFKNIAHSSPFLIKQMRGTADRINSHRICHIKPDFLARRR